jgi:Phosphopantetheine attachment site
MASMELASVDRAHDELSALVAGLMGEARGASSPRPHSSFFAMGGTGDQARELAQAVNALFGLDLPDDVVIRSPTPDALARTIAVAWFGEGGTSAALTDLIGAISDAE